MTEPLAKEERAYLRRSMETVGTQMPTVKEAFDRYEATVLAAEERLRQWEIDADEARGIDEENHHLRLRLKATEERAEKAEAELRRVIGGISAELQFLRLLF